MLRRPLQLSRSVRRTYFSVRDMLDEEAAPRKLPGLLQRPRLPLNQNVFGRFISLFSDRTHKPFRSMVKWMTLRGEEATPFAEGDGPFLYSKPINNSKIRLRDRPHFTWLGHASCLYQLHGKYFLTDPVWAERCAPVQFMGPKRIISPPTILGDVPIDFVLLSHTHYDHMDDYSIRKIGNKPLWIVPLGVKDILASKGVTNCLELDWWESVNLKSNDACNAEIKVVFTPTKHWTSRNPFDRDSCLWGSYSLLSKQHRLFFTGDTAYCDIFKYLGQKYGPYDFAAIPIGAYKPQWFMKNVHCTPEEAIWIHQDLQCKHSVGIHWGTFPLADEGIGEPALELVKARDQYGIDENSVFTMYNGETLIIGEKPERWLEKVIPETFRGYKGIFPAITKKMRLKKNAMANLNLNLTNKKS